MKMNVGHKAPQTLITMRGSDKPHGDGWGARIPTLRRERATC